MNGYFKPLRRKIGVITLVIACVFAAAWVRSFIITDMITMILPTFPPYPFIVSSQEGIGISTMDGLDADHSPDLREWHLFPVWGTTSSYMRFHFRVLTVKHWAIVIPLTLLSAYLLLSKSRKSKSGPTQSEDSTEK